MDLTALTALADAAAGDSDARLAAVAPTTERVRQPVHTAYVPADRFHPGTVTEWGTAATELFAAHAHDVAAIWGVPVELAPTVRERVVDKLAREPIEDLRVDFEDGYGTRAGAEEDETAIRVAGEIGRSGAPFVGIRCRSFEAATRDRAVRTLALLLGALPAIPDGFRITLPKVTAPEQVDALVAVLGAVERDRGWAEGALRFEIQVETPQTVLGPDGASPLPRMIAAAGGRCAGLHYGTFDYSASLGVAPQHQSPAHPVADHAKAVMQVAAANAGVPVSDGSTNVLPVGDADAVRAAWALHGDLVGRSLAAGIYQGWDMHPGHLPSRFVRGFAFYRETFPTAAARLRAYVERAESGFLDEPATARAMAGFLLRGVECGAVEEAEVTRAAGLGSSELATVTRTR